MKPFRDISISRKLTLGYLAASIVPLLTGVALLLAYERASQRAGIVEYLTAQAEMIAVSTRATLEFNDPARAVETIATLKARPMIVAACIYTPDGRVFASYVRPGAGAFHFPAPAAAGHQFLGDHLDLFRPIGGETAELVGRVFLRADLRVLEARFPRYVQIVVAGLFGLVGLSFLLSRFLQGFLSRPILDLEHTVQVVQKTKDYSVRATKFGQDEIGRLTDALNQMMGGIEERDASLRKLNESLQVEVGERQRAEEQAKLRTLELEAAVKELETFSYSVSHDLRAPLRAIDGFSRIALTQHAGELTAEAREALEVVRTSSQQMGRLIDDLLAFSRLSRQPLRKELVSPDEIVRECREILRAEMAGRRVELVIGDLPACEADAGLLKLVWMNLLSNALKYSRKRDPARIEIGCRHEGGSVYFVRDNGVGFKMAYADKLFGVFQRLHRAEDFEGTGVGLATTQRIVLRHGGRIWAEAELNQGATFSFTLEPTRPVEGVETLPEGRPR